jgi:hypothetical protein
MQTKKFESPCIKTYANDIWYKFTELSEKYFVLNTFYFGKFLTVMLFITRQIFYKIDDLHVYNRNFLDINTRIMENCYSGELSCMTGGLSYMTGYVIGVWQGQSSVK